VIPEQGMDLGPRRGAALATAVLFALAMLIAGHGILVFGRTQRWIVSVDGARWVEEETRRAALEMAVSGLDSLPRVGPIATPLGPVEVRGLGPEVTLLVVEPGPTTPGTGWASLVAAALPVYRVRGRTAAARVGGAAFEGPGPPAVGAPELCPPGLDGGLPARIGPLPDSSATPRLGVLELDDLITRLPHLAEDRLDLGRGGDPDCDGIGAFGAPTRPAACPGTWGAASRSGDLILEGGGQGVLAVSGDLTLRRNAHFRGWVWVGGALRVEAGARLEGLADVGDGFFIEPRGAFIPDGCAGAKALEAASALRRPVGIGPPTWRLFRP